MEVTICNVMLDMEPSDYFRTCPVCLLSNSTTYRTLKRKFILQHIHTYIHTYTHTHIHTYIHTYIHTMMYFCAYYIHVLERVCKGGYACKAVFSKVCSADPSGSVTSYQGIRGYISVTATLKFTYFFN